MNGATFGELTGSPAEDRDMPLIAEALAAEGLPVDDLLGRGTSFFVFRERGHGMIGFAGLEQFGTMALLRSLVVLPPARVALAPRRLRRRQILSPLAILRPMMACKGERARR
jgi:hypothetical protein